ncbi:MAG TPA: HAD-IIA family hydrolase [Thermotogota bacterium]|nr:HAD-IIA family hydrolase [Thermotogota bacterium]
MAKRIEASACRELIESKRFFVLDMDGTVTLGGAPLEGAVELVSYLRSADKQLVFLTNNSSKSTDTYLGKLRSVGFAVERGQILTSNEATARFLQEHYPGKSVCFLGTFDAASEMKAFGIPLVLPFDRNQGQQVEVAVLAYDTGLTYEKLKNFCHQLRSKIPFVATHPDLVCPSPEGPLPDVGSFMELIFSATGRRPDFVVGKPESHMVQQLLAEKKISPDQTLIIGDRLYTDIEMGIRLGIQTLLVLSGETDEQMLSTATIQPDFVVDSVGELVKLACERG